VDLWSAMYWRFPVYMRVDETGLIHPHVLDRYVEGSNHKNFFVAVVWVTNILVALQQTLSNPTVIFRKKA
jgi:hypothetical protein